MAWTDLSGANAVNASGTHQTWDVSPVKDFDKVTGYVNFAFSIPLYNGIFNPVHKQQIIDEGGGSGGPTRPTSGLVYPRLV